MRSLIGEHQVIVGAHRIRHRERELTRRLEERYGHVRANIRRDQQLVELGAKLDRVIGPLRNRDIKGEPVNHNLEGVVRGLHVIPRVRHDHVIQNHPHLLARPAGEQVRRHRNGEIADGAGVSLVRRNEQELLVNDLHLY